MKRASVVATVQCKALCDRLERWREHSLKDRLVAADSAASRPKKATDRDTTFVEVQLPSLPSVSPRESSAAGQTVVDFLGTGGVRMRIDVTGTSGVDVVGLAQAFWSHQP